MRTNNWILTCLCLCCLLIASDVNAQLTVTTSSFDATCNGSCDGYATVTATGGVIPYTHLWNDPGSQTTATVTGLCAGTYTVLVTDSNSDTASASITISEPDAITVTITGDTTICIDGSATISASATGGTPPYIYTWDNGLGNDSTHNVTPTTTTTYTVIVIDANLCTGVAQSVTVSTNPPLSVTAFGSDIICYGDSAPITAVANGGDGGPYTYTWDNGAGSGNIVLVSPANTTTSTVMVSDACGTPEASASVTIALSPALVLSPATATICPGESTVFNVSGALTYWWAEEAAPMDIIGTGSTITVSPSVTTSYLVTGDDGVCTRTDTVTVTVNPSPVADFGFIPNETTITNPVFTFTDQSSSSVVSWLWDFGDDSDSSILQNPVHTYADTGTYAVLLTVYDSAGCMDTALYYVIIDDTMTVNVPIIYNKGISVQVFPNPFNSTTTFEVLGTGKPGPLTFELHNILGERVNVMKGISGNKFVISREGLTGGIYFYKISSVDGLFTAGKLVIN
ncbi:MAG: PKD domain-containing protein [Bacteroidota bacterium]